MADTLLFRGGSTADVNSGSTSVSPREIVIDTDTDQIVSGPNKLRTVMENGSGDIAISGNATFAAVATFNGGTSSTSATFAGGDIALNADGSAAFGAGNITLNADGTALFTKTVDVTGSANFGEWASNKRVTITNGDSNANLELRYGANTGGGLLLTGRKWKPAPYDVYETTSQIFSDGSATFAGTINGTTVGTSDLRFKENIEPAHPQLGDVEALGAILKNFDWNEDAPVNEEIRAQRQLGLIAQEAEEICPSLTKEIKRTKQGAELTPEQVVPAVVDEDGVVVEPEKVIPATYEELDDSYKGISHDALIMKLLGAVAELSAKVKALES